MKGTKKPVRRSREKNLRFLAMVLLGLYSVWPVAIMVLEGFAIDLSPIFSGHGVRYIGGVPYYSGGVFPTIVNYLDALSINAFPKLVLHSLTIALLSISIALATGIPVAYALARINLRAKGAISFVLLALRTASPFVVIVPLYILFTRIGLWDTYVGVALAELLLILSVVVWMLRGFFAEIPEEVYDAARVFGGGEGQIFRRVALPAVLPGIVVTALFAFILIWNEFLIADVLTGPVARTAAVGVWTGLGEHAASFKVVDWAPLNAAGALAFLPAVSVMLAIRRYLARGFSLGLAK